MVAPPGQSRWNAAQVPEIEKKALNPIAIIIMRDSLTVNKLAIAAGIVSMVMTRMIPTTWISSTIVIAMRTRSSR